MKVLQLNLWMGRLMRKVKPLITKENPDVICLQEVFSCKESILLPDNLFNSLEQIIDLGYPHVYFSPIVETLVEDKKVNYGNAIVSKVPLSNAKTVFTCGGFVSNRQVDKTAFTTCNLQIVQLETGNGVVNVANHHGFWCPNPIGTEETIASMKRVADELKKLKNPLVFCGDLNVSPQSPSMRVFDGWLDDLTATFNVKDTLTALGKVAGVPCDHILISPDVVAKNFGVLDEVVSDHRALVVTFSV